MKNVRDLIREDRTAEAIVALKKLLDQRQAVHELDGLTLLESQYNRWQNNKLGGLEAPDRELIRIQQAILATYGKYEDRPDIAPVNKKETPSMLNYALGFAGLIGLLLLFFLMSNQFGKPGKMDAAAELKKESIMGFYRNAKPKLNELDNLFEAYCEFKDSTSQNELDDAMGDFYEFRNNTQFIDDKLLKSLADYNNFISEMTFEIDNDSIESIERRKIYRDSKALLDVSLDLLDEALKEL